MDNLRRLADSQMSDRHPAGPVNWYVSVWYFGGRRPDKIATFALADEEAAMAFYHKTVTEGPGLKEVILGQEQELIHTNGQRGRSSMISLWVTKSRRLSKWISQLSA